MLSSLLSTLKGFFGGPPPSAAPRASAGASGRVARPGIETLEDRCLLSDGSMLFLGDSITWFYANGLGAASWAAAWAPLGAVNYGIPELDSGELKQLVQLGFLVGTDPNGLVILTIGTNDLIEGHTSAEAAAGVLSDVKAIHNAEPGATILVMGIPPFAPYFKDQANHLGTINQTNDLIRQEVAGLPYAHYGNIGWVFLQPDGSFNELTLLDGVHPTPYGYALETLALLPVVTQYL
jgi:lysophospholipase L1-like esterase